MIKNYLKTAWRNVKRNKGYTAINVLGLAIGITACLMIYLITSFELSYDNFHTGKDRIYRIVAKEQSDAGNTDYMGGMMNPLPTTARNELTGFEDVTTFHNYFASVVIPNGVNETKRFDAAKRGEEASPIIIAEPNYFKLFTYQWLQGSAASALNEPFKVVLSENEAHKYFGNGQLDNVIGKEVIYKDIYLNDSLRLTVSGIVKDWDKNTDFGFRDFISRATIEHSFLSKQIHLNHWGNWNPDAQGFVKLASGVTPQRVEKQFPQFVKKHVPPYPGHTDMLSLQPLADIHFNTLYRDDYSRKAHLPTLYGLMVIAIFILIIAAINFINLSTAQSLSRAKEIGVRKVLGSSRASLTMQFLSETFAVTLMAVIISVAITSPVMAAFSSMLPPGLTLNLFNPVTLVFLFSITVVTSLLAGFYPAKVLASYLPVLSLKGQGAQKLKGSVSLRKTLIVFQFTISLVFIISTLIIGNQMHFVLNKDLGFTKDAIVTFRTAWGTLVNKLTVFAEQLKQVPGVQLVSRHMETPAAANHSASSLSMAGTNYPASYEMSDENYVPLYGLKIIAGRNITHSDTVREFLINETLATTLGFSKPEKAIGKILKSGMNDKNGVIVGVVKDFYAKSLHESIAPFYISSFSDNEKSVSVKLATTGKQFSNFTTAIKQINKIWKASFPDQKFEYSFFDATIAKLYDTEQKTAQLMNTAMAIAIFISCMGLFGLATFTARQRGKEIGIRKVLGASVTGIVTMLSRDFLGLVVISLIIASPIAYYFMHGWLQNFAYRVDVNWWVFVIAGLSAGLITVITISFQTIKAALTNPVKSLRSE